MRVATMVVATATVALIAMAACGHIAGAAITTTRSQSASYPQDISQRYSLTGGTIVSTAWPVLSLPTPLVRAAGGPSADDVWFLAAGELWAWDTSTNTTAQVSVSPAPLGSLPSSTRWTADPTSSTVALAQPSGITWLACSSATACSIKSVTKGTVGTLVTGVGAAAGRVYVGGTAGLYSASLTTGTLEQVAEVTEPVVAIASLGATKSFAVATPMRLWTAVPTASKGALPYWTDTVVDSNVTALAFGPDGTLWVACWDALTALYQGGESVRYGFTEGLPVANLTDVSVDSADASSVYVASAYGGVARLDVPAQPVPWWLANDEQAALAHVSNLESAADRAAGRDATTMEAYRQLRRWRERRAASRDPSLHAGEYGYGAGLWSYRNGPRWLSDSTVGSVFVAPAAGGISRTFVTGTNGLSVIRREMWTLQQKAAWYYAMVEPRHDRFGLVADCDLAKFGDTSTYIKGPRDNDGTWTATYVAGQVMNWAATRDPAMKADAIKHWSALELLNNVTGFIGLPARSYDTRGASHSRRGGEWFNSTAPGYTQWSWKGNTSSDEITSHMMIHPMVHDLLFDSAVPEEAAMAKRAAQITINIMDNILRHNLTLIDGPRGKRTRWGFWDPQELNEVPDNYSERGSNAMEILVWLVQVYRLTGNTTYLDIAQDLGEAQGYYEAAATQHISVPDDIDHSDDMLETFTSLGWWWTMQRLPQPAGAKAIPLALQQAVNVSLAQQWRYNTRLRTAFYVYAYAAMMGVANDNAAWQADFARAIDDLEQWPLELVTWPYKNSQRQDYVPDLSRMPPGVGPRGSGPGDRYFDSADVAEVSATARAGAAPDVNVGESTNALPPSERSAQRLQQDPFALDGGGGMTEQDPGAWMIGYYFGLKFGYIA